ncbi:TPA: hypothetical protein NJ407_004124 [Vibrio parahaemolyticus]|nr:hypothetical protein [Vibrio parahaemolyticus]HCG9589091.1 hypothetical protein [Vibrio parahaemolyticus]
MSNDKTLKRITITNKSPRWRIKNRFVGFGALMMLALLCLIAPKNAEQVLNRETEFD